MQVTQVSIGELATMAAPCAHSEEWRPVRGGVYEVSSLGRVRNATTGHIKAQQGMPNGYRQVGLFKKDRAYVHRLVAEAFRGAPAPGLEVNHRDGDKSNNRADNLEWVTHSENQRHAFRTLGTLKLNLPIPRGENNPAAKLTDDRVTLVRVLVSLGALQRSVGSFFGVGQSAVSNIVNRRTWKHVA